jgi:hypothetical protein
MRNKTPSHGHKTSLLPVAECRLGFIDVISQFTNSNQCQSNGDFNQLQMSLSQPMYFPALEYKPQHRDASLRQVRRVYFLSGSGIFQMAPCRPVWSSPSRHRLPAARDALKSCSTRLNGKGAGNVQRCTRSSSMIAIVVPFTCEVFSLINHSGTIPSR